MARIPGPEDLGNVVPRLGRYNEQQIPGDAFGAGVGPALQRAAAVVGQAERQMAAQAEQEAREAAAAREAAEKGQALDVIESTKARLTEDHDDMLEGLRSGQVDKRSAGQEWERRSKERVADAMQGLPMTYREVIERELGRSSFTLGRSVGKAVVQRDRQDATASFDALLESASREYGTNAKLASAKVAEAVKTLGPATLYTPEQLGKKGQAWLEDAQFTKGFSAVSAGRDDRGALDAAEKTIAGLEALDPQRRAQLNDRIASYRLHLDQKAEIAAARQQRQAEALLKRAESVFSAATVLADKGILRPDYADAVITQLGGTPYAAAFKQVIETQRASGSLAMQPIDVQRATLDAVNAQIASGGGLTEALEKRREQVEKTLRGSEEDFARDPLRAIQERQLIDQIAPLDMSSPQAIADSLAGRLQQAQLAQQYGRRPVSPLLPQETERLKGMLETLPAKERAGAVGVLAQALGPAAAQGLAMQIDKQDRGLALAFASTDRTQAEMILAGQAAKKDGTSTKGEKVPELKAGQWKAYAATRLTNVFGNDQFSGQVRDAAELIMHAMAARAGGRLSRDDMDKALNLALGGGSLIEGRGRSYEGANGRQERAALPLPAGVNEDMLDQRLRAVTARDLAQYLTAEQQPGQQPQDLSKANVVAGGVSMPVAEFLKILPGQELMPVRPGQYAVIVDGRPVVGPGGREIIIKVAP